MAKTKVPKKIILSIINTEKIVSIALISIFSFLLIISIFLYNFIGLSWENLIIHGLMIFVFILFFFSLNNISQVSIIGDCILVKKSNTKRYITPIKSIRKVRQFPLFRFQLYSLEFKIDGNKQKVRFLSTIDKVIEIQRLAPHRPLKVA